MSIILFFYEEKRVVIHNLSQASTFLYTGLVQESVDKDQEEGLIFFWITSTLLRSSSLIFRSSAILL